MLDALTFEIMNATADDWESLEQILRQVRRSTEQVQANVVAAKIARLVNDGLLEEMKGRTVLAQEILADPMEHWFRMTPCGREIWTKVSPTYATDKQ